MALGAIGLSASFSGGRSPSGTGNSSRGTGSTEPRVIEGTYDSTLWSHVPSGLKLLCALCAISEVCHGQIVWWFLDPTNIDLPVDTEDGCVVSEELVESFTQLGGRLCLNATLA